MTEDKPGHSCGVVGVYDVPDAAKMLYLGLHALQHRGQESAGIVVSDGEKVRSKRGMGLLSNVFSAEDLEQLPGCIGVGHVRYSTAGSSKPQNIQPLVLEYSEGLVAVAHNGNLVNARALRSELESTGSIFQTSTDSEVVVHLMARPENVARENNIGHCLSLVRGAYSILFMGRRKLVAVRDPQGFRPLAVGRLGSGYIVASETCAFDQTGAEFLYEVEPGEMVTIDETGIRREYFVDHAGIRPAHCIFEHVYFARPDSVIFGETVHEVRKRFGRVLAAEHPVEADVVCPVPDSGRSASIGYSRASGIPIDRGFIRNHYVGRTFLAPVQTERSRAAHLKHNLVRDVVRDKRVILVDDSLIRGTTMKALVQHLRAAGTKEVHLRISCPPHRYPCFYGVDFPTREELIANKYTVEEIAGLLDLDTLGYLSIDGMLDAVGLPRENWCTACWSNDYPVSVTDSADDKYRMEGALVR